MTGVPLGTASAWKTRGSIPDKHWEGIVAEAGRRGLEGITLEALAKIAAKRRQPDAAPAQTVSA